MTIDAFTISLDKPTSQYSPGENVTGKLYIQLSQPDTASEVTVRFFGFPQTHWTQAHLSQRKDGFSIDDYDGYEMLFESVGRLFGDGNTGFTLPVGQTVLPFTLQVPMRPLPVNCSFQDGQVWYGLEGCIKNPQGKDTKTGLLPITIFTMVDLNSIPDAGNAMQVVGSQEFGSYCCKTEPCLIQTFTPKLGFAIGEVIPLAVEIQNKSDRKLVDLNATLIQVWILLAKERDDDVRRRCGRKDFDCHLTNTSDSEEIWVS